MGIELNNTLCNAARVNAARLRGKKAPMEIRCEDAAKADVSDGTIYFLFNPFGADTMRDVLAGIKQSLAANPRKVTLVYFNPVLVETLRASGWMREVDGFKTFTGGQFTFWTNR